MSDRSRAAISWFSVIGVCFALIGGAWAASAVLIKVGRIMNGIDVIEGTVKRLESKLESDTKEMRQSVLDLKEKHEELKHRVDLIERMDSRKINGYERTK